MSHALAEKYQDTASNQFVDSSLHMIKDEVEQVLAFIATQLDSETDNPESVKELDKQAAEKTITQLAQLSGALSMVEISAGALLVEHLKLALEKLVNQEGGPTIKQRQAIFESCFLFSRYLHYLINARGGKGDKIPLILAPNFYLLASAGVAPFVDESELVGINCLITASTEESSCNLDTEQQLTIRRLRKMYQVGLIGLLKKSSVPEQLKLIHHVTKRMSELLPTPFISNVWHCLGSLVESFQSEALTLSAQRSHFFARFDRYLKDLSKNQWGSFQSSEDSKCLKELVFLLEMSDKREFADNELGQFIEVDTCRWTEQQVESQRKLIETGLKDSLSAMSEAVTEQLTKIKSRLNVMSESEICEDSDVDFLLVAIESIQSVLKFCGFEHSATALSDSNQLIMSWRSSLPEQADLLNLANVVLTVENELLCYSLGNADGSLSSEHDMSLEEGLTHQAHQHLYIEIQSNISLAHRALNSYMESDFDREHISNVSSCLKATVGGFRITGIDLAAELMDCCAVLIDNEYKNKEKPAVKKLESLADSLVSMEYLLHELLGGRNIDGSVKQLLKENLDAVNHELNAS